MDNKLKTLIILFKAHQSLTKNVKLSLQDTALTVNEFTVMEALYSKESLYPNQLIDKILIPNSSLTYVLDILEKKDYIIRQKDVNDGRRQQIRLTETGKKIFVDVYQKHYQHMQEIFQVLTAKEESRLQELLKKLGKKAEEVSQL